MPILASLLMSLTAVTCLLLLSLIAWARRPGAEVNASQPVVCDPPSRAVRRPIVLRFFMQRVDRWVDGLLPQPLRLRLQSRLRLAGKEDTITPASWVATQLMASVGIAGVVLIFAIVGAPTSLRLSCVLLALPWAMAHLQLRSAARRRLQQMLRALPAYLDLLSLGLEAGLSFGSALQIAVERGAPGALKAELQQVLQLLRAGRSRGEALAQFAARSADEAVAGLVSSIAQADAVGASLVVLLRSHAERSLQQRFARAEKLAMEAPVKMLAPLVCCIFPCTFLVVGFPIAAKLFWGA